MQGGLGTIPGRGAGSHMPQLKSLHAATKIEDPVWQLGPSAAKINKC